MSSTAVGSLAGRVRHGVDVDDSELFGGADLSFGQDTEVGRVVFVLRPDAFGDNLHQNQHAGKVTHLTHLQHHEHTLATGHGPLPGALRRGNACPSPKSDFAPEMPRNGFRLRFLIAFIDIS